MTSNEHYHSDALKAWRPPPGFVPAPSTLEGIEIYAPAPEPQAPEQRTFKCPRCGASTAYSAKAAALICAHCGYTEQPDAPVVGRTAPEAEFTVETLERASQGWGRARQEIHCESCGANFSLDPNELATTCPFCASHRVIAQDETPSGMLRPTHLIPFQIDRARSTNLLYQWMEQGWMYPAKLCQAAHTAQLHGVYLPYWVFSAHLCGDWRAEIGRKHTRTTLSGKRKTEIKWTPKSGEINLRIDDMLTPGADKLSARLLGQLYPFDLTALTVYDAAYLAGWQAQAYEVSLRPAWDQARAWMRQQAQAVARRDINARRVRDLELNLDLEKERWRYVLLPVYLVAYRFQDRSYQVMINGQTGEVVGQKPVAWRRVGGVLVLSFLPAVLMMVLAALLDQTSSGLLLMMGLGAAIVALAVAVRVLRQAFAADDV